MIQDILRFTPQPVALLFFDAGLNVLKRRYEKARAKRILEIYLTKLTVPEDLFLDWVLMEIEREKYMYAGKYKFQTFIYARTAVQFSFDDKQV